MEAPERILVPVDLSRRSERAVAYAAMLARRCGSSLIVMVNVNLREQEVLEELEAEPEAALARIIGEHAADLPTSTVVTSGGFPADAILDTASAEDVDLIVVASHGRSGMTRWMLGSVAEKVVRVADVPVTVVPARD